MLREAGGFKLDCSVVGDRSDAEDVKAILDQAPRLRGQPIHRFDAEEALRRAGYALRRFESNFEHRVIRAHIARARR